MSCPVAKFIEENFGLPSLGARDFQFKFDDGSGLQNFQEYSVSISPTALQNSQVSSASGTLAPGLVSGPGPLPAKR